MGDIRGGRKTMGAKGRRRRKGEKKDKGEGEPLYSELVVQLWPQAPLGKTPSLSQLGLASRSRGQGFTGPSSLWRKGGKALNGGFHLCQVTSCLQLTKLPRRRRGGGLEASCPPSPGPSHSKDGISFPQLLPAFSQRGEPRASFQQGPAW